MTAYYNEYDKKTAAWLRELIRAGHIAPGIVDERSIEDVFPSDLRGFTQCHFFAGIGVWSYALRRAGWSDDRPVWTGSCPCQPFSASGKGVAFADKRHLWPAFNHLIQECKPTVVFGEQVASKNADDWVDLVCADLEAMGYAFGAVPFPSAGVGAPHIRDRTYWMAYSNMPNEQRQQLLSVPVEPEQEAGGCSPANHWSFDDVIRCADGKTRPIKSSIQPLAHGFAARVGRLRGYGNAVNAEAARVFIQCAMEAA